MICGLKNDKRILWKKNNFKDQCSVIVSPKITVELFTLLGSPVKHLLSNKEDGCGKKCKIIIFHCFAACYMEKAIEFLRMNL